MIITKWNELTDGPLTELDHGGRHYVSADVALSRHGIKYTTLRKHCRLGSPLLPNNRKPGTHTVNITGRSGTRPREYFDEADLIAMKTDRTYPVGYVDDQQAHDDFGFVGSFLWKYSNERHPAIKRKIKTKPFNTVRGNQTVELKLYRRQHLKKIRKWMQASSSQLTTSKVLEAMDRLTSIDPARLKHLRKAKRIRSEKKTVRTARGHARIGYVHRGSDVARELKIISDEISKSQYGIHVDHDGTWRSRSNASSTYGIPAVTLDGYIAGHGPHGMLHVKDVPILMKGDRRRGDHVKTQPGLNDEDLKRIAESRKTHGKASVLRREGFDWLPPTLAAELTGVARRKLHTMNAELGAKLFEVQAGPRKWMVWHYRKDKLIEHFPGISETRLNDEALEEIRANTKHLPAIRKTSETTLDTVTLTDTKVSRIVGGKKRQSGKDKVGLPQRGRGQPKKSPEKIAADAKVFENLEASGTTDTDFDRLNGWKPGTTRAAVKRHRNDIKLKRIPMTQ